MKDDAERIKQFLQNLSEEEWIKRSERRWWPRFVFHYTDIMNAAKVLNGGVLYSRQEAETRNLLSVSSGSSAVLAGTKAFVQSCVRFYFRPQTPTQFHAEGVRSANSLSKSPYPDAHCPVPVFFLFDSEYILSLDECQFSDSGLASPKAKLLSKADELEKLPWKKIYHTGWFDPTKEDIKIRRSAEVLVPNKLDLKALRYIYCRSEAEKETLSYLILKLEINTAIKLPPRVEVHYFFESTPLFKLLDYRLAQLHSISHLKQVPLVLST